MKVCTGFSRKAQFYILATLLLIINDNIFSQNIGEVSVKKWKDDKPSAFSFSFDDSFESQYVYARPVLDQYGFKGTFYLITETLDEQDDSETGKWNEFRGMAQNGHEMGSHTVSHPHLKKLSAGDINTPNTLHYEFYHSKLRIEQEIPNQKCITLAYPFAEFNATVTQVAKQYFESARADGSMPISSSPTEAQFYTLTAKELLFNVPRNSVSSDDDEYTDFQNTVNSSVTNGKWLILMAHEVVPFSKLAPLIQQDAWYPMTQEWLDRACQLVKNKEDNKNVWVETIANVTRYIKERDGFSAQLISANNSEINLNITDALPNDIFNYPLTVDITVPSSWTDVVFKQGSRTENLTAFVSSGKTIVRTQIIPDGGAVKLTGAVSTPTFTLGGQIIYNNTSGTPVKNVVVNLSGPNGLQRSASTTSSGQYLFDNLASGNYTVSFSKTTGWGGVNATDALETLRFFTGQITFDSLQAKAANVNNSGGVNATDALLILNRFAGVITSFPLPDWIFDSPSINITIQGSSVVSNSKVIAAGEVNKSLVPVN